MLKKLLIFPFGGNARESLASISAINMIKKEWDVLGFIDDDDSVYSKECCGIKVIGNSGLMNKFSDTFILAVPGNPETYLKRKLVIENLGIDKERFVVIAHPSASISPDAVIGYNTLIMSNVIISCGVKIGRGCIILPNTVISHDSIVGDYSCIGSNVTVSGGGRIGDECYIGSGVSIRENISIGKRSLVGIGSNIITDINEDVVAAGNPARVIRKVVI